jgi:hypothetical protein
MGEFTSLGMNTRIQIKFLCLFCFFVCVDNTVNALEH